MTRLILASASASRQRLLKAAGVDFEVVAARIDEDEAKARGASGRAVAALLAERKALHVGAARPDGLVIGADQVLVLDTVLMSKPGSLAEARDELRTLRGRRHALMSAVVLARGGEVLWRHVAEASLTMRAFSDAFLEAYLAAEADAVMASVGCYRLEGLGAQLFESVEGDYFSILGLPLLPLLAALREHGAITT